MGILVGFLFAFEIIITLGCMLSEIEIGGNN
jgi:hypothetical protein